MDECTENINKALELARELIDLGDKGDEERKDESCGVLYGVIKDTGYRILNLAIKEKSRHIEKGTWIEPVASAE